ncbi:MAG: DUF4270 domain-containing protein [Bacteroidota bacterium]
MLWSRLTNPVPLSRVFILSVFVIFSSCTKDPADIGNTLTPTQDKLLTRASDTFSVWIHSELNDTIITNKTEYSLVGSYMDPVFGLTTASFATQFELNQFNPTFGPNPAMDSLILTLDYAGYYGDTNTVQTFRIYEVTEDMYADTTYYSYSEIRHSATPLALFTFKPHPTDSVMVDTIKKPAHIRINLGQVSHELGNRILTTAADNLSSNEKFKQIFKGLYMAADPVSYKGAILYFDAQSLATLTKLSLYYHNDTVDSLRFNMSVFPVTTARYTHFDHNHYNQAGQDLRRQIIYGDTAAGQQNAFIQAMGGVRAHLRLPFIPIWKDGRKVAINEALLTIPCESPSDLVPPSQLYLKRVTESGGYSTLLDESLGGSTYFGGTYQSTDKQYGFRITRYVQEMMKGESPNYGLALLVTGAAVRSSRVILHGPGRIDRPMKLRVTYSYPIN